MELNAYQPCPCHAEQKIKFCCGKQIVDDLNQVMALAHGQQTLATLDTLDRLIRERGPKDCLLTLKTHFLITLMEIDKARECNEQFLLANPKHPIGMQHRAMIFLTENKLVEAVGALQDAMEGIKGSAVPVSLGNAFRLVGLELLRHGQPIAARQHLSFARSLNKSDEQAAMLIIESYRMPTRSLLLKQDLEMPAAPTDQPWSKTYHQLRRLAARGQWRMAMQYLELKLLPLYPYVALFHKAIAILALRLARNDKAILAWANYAAAQKITDAEAIDAEMWVQLLSESDSTRSFNIAQFSATIVDIEKLLERLDSADRFARVSTEYFEDGEGPPPKAAFVFLDRAAVLAASEITIDRIPNVLTEFLVFGRQTDHEARVEFDLVEDGTAEGVLGDLASLLSDSVDFSKQQREVVGEISEKQNRLSSRWHLPPDFDRSQVADLERRNEEQILLEVWPQIAVPSLDDKSPNEVKGDPKYRIKLQALIGETEMADQMHEIDPELINRLRTKLDLPLAEDSDPQQFTGHPPTLFQRQHVRWELASDDVVLANFYYAMSAGHWSILRKTSAEIIRRPDLELKVPLENVCSVLANITKDDNESLSYLRQARKIAHAKGQPQGIWLVAELELRIKRGITEKIDELTSEIRTRHMKEPNVESRMRRLVVSTGFGENTGRVDEADAELAPAGSRDESEAIWTPQSASAAGGSGKLWLPGAD